MHEPFFQFETVLNSGYNLKKNEIKTNSSEGKLQCNIITLFDLDDTVIDMY